MHTADARHDHKTLEKKLQAIYTLRGGPSIDLTIRKPYIELLAALGNPHYNLPPVIHVAGTNGKGSVIAMLRAIFEKAGYRVHAYTSPHLVRFNERILLAGKHIDNALLGKMLDEVMAANKDAPLTFFEITTALAFCAFARVPADICLLETGLGGRLDCTNVVEKPLATIITRIGFDHMEFLGDTLEKIAAEKAGIMKQSTPCILAPQQNSNIEQVFEKHAQELGTILVKTQTKTVPAINMHGLHQRDNAAAVLSCLSQIKGFDLPRTTIENGLQNVYWPARLQKTENPQLPEDCELWVDGGHNESAGAALAAQAKHWQQTAPKKLHLILGMMNTKDPAEFVRPLLPYLDKLTCIAIPDNESTYMPEELKTRIGAISDFDIQTAESPEKAIKGCKKPQRIVIAGSLYLAGHCLKTGSVRIL